MANIYTKTGDKGKTGLIGGKRVWKDSPQIEACGAIDELSAYLGVTIDLMISIDLAKKPKESTAALLKDIQHTLITIGSQLANTKLSSLQHDLTEIEKRIDKIQNEIPTLRKFILPGGHPIISLLNLSRCICRRAERCIVTLSRKQHIEPTIIPYLNRLSDLLFVLTRWLLKMMKLPETT